MSFKLLTIFAVLTVFAVGAAGQNFSKKFNFGTGRAADGFTSVSNLDVYGKEKGYGFEPGAEISCFPGTGKNVLRSGFCASEKPFYFSIAVPEGNYKVKITFGDAKAASVATVKAELRRLMLEKVVTEPGKHAAKSFVVNVRTPQIAGGAEVKLKDREKTMEWQAWDEKLTLEFNGARPAINSIEIERVEVPTVFLLGDSTVCDQPREPYASWGQMLPAFFAPGIAVANHAESGESLKSSLGARRLDKVLGLIKPRDYLIIQYGHNDQKDKAPDALAAYKANLKRFAADARKKGATPVFVTPMHRLTFDAAGKITNSHGDYPAAVREAAREENAPLIELDAMSKSFYEALGVQKAKTAFKEGDATHHNNYGSYELAKMIVEGIKVNKISLAKYLKKDLPPFNPSRPDAPESVAIPASPLTTDVKPLGN